MTIDLSPEVAKRILDAIRSGRFRSVDEAVTTVWMEWERKQNAACPPQVDDDDASPDPLIGLWSDCAEEIDEIVTDAYRQRREQPWRGLDL